MNCRSTKSRCCSVVGRRLFDALPVRIELEVVRVLDTLRPPTFATVVAS